ncbi:hypothetical protein [Tenacibaculum aquimarinum]|uniref:hypothetical protein n=1 Tax=Tenacibaculum aquimarinum TaxID=2910675 RepID=UPI001F0A3DBC|nr:hypothetical protein [Tenacibaculum aquimarinum]MCH3883739.1 hypothetical protein [Tenacibaculum aquimarinum]
MIEFGILIVGIILYLLGRKSYYKFERDRKDKNNNSGVFLQLNTILLYSGFILIVFSILAFFFL